MRGVRAQRRAEGREQGKALPRVLAPAGDPQLGKEVAVCMPASAIPKAWPQIPVDNRCSRQYIPKRLTG